MSPYAFPQIQNFETKISVTKKHGVRFRGHKRHSSGRLHASGSTVNAAPYLTTWHSFDKPFKTKRGECCQAACASSTTTRGPIPLRWPRRFWKNSSGLYWIIRSSLRNSSPGFPLLSSPKETSRWKKFRETMMRCNIKSWSGSKGWRQTSMTRWYKICLKT